MIFLHLYPIQFIIGNIVKCFVQQDLDRTWSELEQAMRGKQTNLNEVLQGAEMETFQIHALMSALYKKTAVVKVTCSLSHPSLG